MQYDLHQPSISISQVDSILALYIRSQSRLGGCCHSRAKMPFNSTQRVPNALKKLPHSFFLYGE